MKAAERPIGTQLSRLSSANAMPARIAAVAEAHWQSIRAALSPIIGRQGVAALYGRSLHLVRARFPWLEAPEARASASAPFTLLRLSLASQSREDAVSAQGALLQAFVDLLISLIGGPLTERLLAPVCDRPPDDHEAEGSIP